MSPDTVATVNALIALSLALGVLLMFVVGRAGLRVLWGRLAEATREK